MRSRATIGRRAAALAIFSAGALLTLSAAAVEAGEGWQADPPAASPAAKAAITKGAAGQGAKPAAGAICGEPGRHGTRVEWVGTLEQASKDAARDGKLVFVMHISGNFAREEFT